MQARMTLTFVDGSCEEVQGYRCDRCGAVHCGLDNLYECAQCGAEICDWCLAPSDGVELCARCAGREA